MDQEAFSWKAKFESELTLADGSYNMAYQCLDRHLGTPTEQKVAIKFIQREWPEKKDHVQEMTYKQLQEKTCQFARALNSLNIKKGDKVFSLLPRIPELYVTALGSLRRGAIFCPLFSAFGSEPIHTRMKIGGAQVLVSLASYYQKKIAPIRFDLPELQYLILVNDIGERFSEIPSAIDFESFINNFSTNYYREKTLPDDIALLHFTSGTTGKPKGAIHAHSAAFYHQLSGQKALDLRPTDIFWCTADPGWVTGTSYGIISPLINGATLLVDESDFNSERWYQILEGFKVTNWYTAPTALRMLMKSGPEQAKNKDLSQIRYACSVGEPLNPEVVHWFERNLKLLIHDNWWQTETGGIIIANTPEITLKYGSMGRAMPGIDVRLVRRTQTGGIEFITDEQQPGEIAIHQGWPSMFRGYLREEERYKKCFVGEYYLSGDIARRDRDGYFWFMGRSDDLIKSSGHLIGPFEVESTLMEHPAVLEAAVIGTPDPMVGEIVKAFVCLKSGYKWNDELMANIQGFARRRLGAVVAPKEISYIESLPKTKSGKILRRLLRARELGLPEGDLSTLEPSL